jgi:NADH:ubiquinone oxidoreductase subunit H
MIKEPILPSSANLFSFIMAPIITFMLSLIAWAVIPCVVLSSLWGMSRCLISSLCQWSKSPRGSIAAMRVEKHMGNQVTGDPYL